MPEAMVGFGYKQAWLAVRDGAAGDVALALGLRDLGPVPWRHGVDLAYLTDDRVAVTPPLAGAGASLWLLVTGRWLVSPHSPVDTTTLSAALGTEVQLYVTHRVVELHRWERAVDGTLMRAFQYVGEAGEIMDWRGQPDDAELAAGLPMTPDSVAEVLVSEMDVMRIASRWSVDPTSLEGRPAPGPLHIAAAPATG
jgi:hypothetical protein